MTHVTQHDIEQGLRCLDLKSGDKVLAHSALSSFGHVKGGANAVIDALLAVTGTAGTVLVPTLTGSETLSPENPPVFDPARTPCWTGRIPETFRLRAAAVRSLHPTHSVAAIGTDAEALTREHLNSITPCDEQSPYGQLAALDDGYILLIGVGHSSNTTLHHVEELAAVEYHLQKRLARAAIMLDGRHMYRHIFLHQYGTLRNFAVIEPLLVERGIQVETRVGPSMLKLVQIKPMVEVTLRCLRANSRFLCAD
ncbi:MAG: AAC(3) family N-acetyltransferase [Anaerolineae bacterium]|nr:AAC(3) family N-acetyltransferase [Anaerolineae bacterium]